jgi:hypothetical protein
MFEALLLLLPPALPWLAWYVTVNQVTTLASTHRDRMAAYLSPVLCVAILWLRIAIGAEGIQSSWALFNFMAAVLAIGCLSLPWLGLSVHADVAERRNCFAGIAIAGAMMGLTRVCAGAAVFAVEPGQPIPNGTVFFAVALGVLGSAVFFVLVIAIETMTHLSEAVTIDRDGGVAVRLAGLLAGLGLLVGHAFEALPTGSDRRVGLAFAAPQILAAGTVALELAMRRRRRFGGPDVIDGLVAILYLGAAGCATWLLR